MMKYRVWNTDRSRWETGVVLGMDGRPVGWSDRGTGLVFQFDTTLKDKNGVEVYEGDIVHCQAGKGVVTARYGGLFIVDWQNGVYNKCIDSWVDGGKFEGEVIGNIYDNPELLHEAA